MLKISKLKKIKSNFPVIVGEQIISKKVCNSLIKEITNSKSFDDMIMGGSSRINKGSQVLKSQKNFLLLSIQNPFIKKLIKNLKQNLRQILGKVCLNQKNLIKKNIH